MAPTLPSPRDGRPQIRPRRGRRVNPARHRIGAASGGEQVPIWSGRRGPPDQARPRQEKDGLQAVRAADPEVAAAVRAAAEGRFGIMVALAPPTVVYVDLEEAIRHTKLVPLDCDTILTARSLGICLGD